MVTDAGHHRHGIEHAGGAEEEVIPVGPFVAAVDEVAGEQDEIDRGMTAMSGGEKLAPAFEAGLSVAEVEESYAGRASGRLTHRHGPPLCAVPSPSEYW